MFLKSVDEIIKRPSEHGVKINQITERALMKGLSLRAADRYQSINEFALALNVDLQSDYLPYVEINDIRIGKDGVPYIESPSSHNEPNVSPPIKQTETKFIKHKGKIIAAVSAVAAVLIAVAGISYFTNNNDTNNPEAPEATLTQEKEIPQTTIKPTSKLTAVSVSSPTSALEPPILAKWSIESSSHLIASSYIRDYSAYNAYDDNPVTFWIPGPSTLEAKVTPEGRKIRYGIGQYLDFYLQDGNAKDAYVNSIDIINGGWRSANDDFYGTNNRAKEIEIIFDGDYSIKYILEDQSDKEIDYQNIPFDPPVAASHIRIKFLSVYEGTDVSGNRDLLIAEVKINADIAQ